MGDNNQNNNQYDPRRIKGGKRVQKKRRRSSVPPTVIAIYIVMVLLILAICAVVCVVSFKNSNKNSGSSDSGASESSVVSEISDNSEISSDVSSSVVPDNSSDISSASTDSSIASSTIETSGSSSSTATQYFPVDYSKDFFADDLFIGDSIFTGISGYGYLSADNVAAKIGYTPSSAMNKAFDTKGVNAVDYAKQRQPKRIFIMLGSNTMAAGNNYDTMVSQYSQLVKQLRANCPKSLICVISIPPVTADSSAAKTGNITNENIRSVNTKLKSMATQNGVDYYDLNTAFSDDNGNFKAEFAEQDGLHFMGSTYKVLLAMLEDIMSGENSPYYYSSTN